MKLFGKFILTALGVGLVAVVLSFGAQLVALPLRTHSIDFGSVVGLASSLFITTGVVLGLRYLWTRDEHNRPPELACRVDRDRRSHPLGK